MSSDEHTDDAPHPLQRAWTLWYDSQTTFHDNWELALKPIMTVRTVEEFFLMLKYMKPVHALRTATQYHFFQENVKPMWEDSANKKGGKLYVNIHTARNADLRNADLGGGAAAADDADGKTHIDTIWKNVLMAIVGEYLENGNVVESQITGVVMTKRKYFNRLAVWVRDADATDAIKQLKQRIIDETGLTSSIEFSKHADK